MIGAREAVKRRQANEKNQSQCLQVKANRKEANVLLRKEEMLCLSEWIAELRAVEKTPPLWPVHEITASAWRCLPLLAQGGLPGPKVNKRFPNPVLACGGRRSSSIGSSAHSLAAAEGGLHGPCTTR